MSVVAPAALKCMPRLGLAWGLSAFQCLSWFLGNMLEPQLWASLHDLSFTLQLALPAAGSQLDSIAPRAAKLPKVLEQEAS